MARLTDEPDAIAPFFVVFGERADLKPAYRIVNRAERARFVAEALQAVAERSQAGARGYLRGRRVEFTPFWIENKIYVPRGTLALARALARMPEVVAILPELIYTVPPAEPAASESIQAIEWNISRIRADQVWPTTEGQGRVVANIDTGVQYTHPAVNAQYRGNLGGGNYNHTGNWRDPTNICGATPCDNNGHGTHTMGTMVGDDGGSNHIGVAPGAKWIACKGCATNSCSDFDLTTCAQWIVSPDGQSPPDVVNNSWGGGGGDPWYRTYVQSWRAAGIFPAFSNGNSGPNCSTSGSPGDYAESYSSGATDINNNIASFSSRGPSSFSQIIKPNVSAPGVSVRSSVPTNGYASFSGTSMASPHTAATVALVWAAAPAYDGNIGGTEQILNDSAFALFSTTQTCNSVPGTVSPNNTFGHGLLDAFAAVQLAQGPGNQSPAVTITNPGNGAQINCNTSVNFTGTATDPEDGNISASLVWTDNGGALGSGASFPRTYTCTEAGSHAIIASVTDSGGASDSDTITINIVDPGIPNAPGNLAASVSGPTVTLSWNDNSNNEEGFRLERKKKGTNPWGVVQTLGAGVTSTTDAPGRGNWDYRVRAFKGTLQSDPSNVVTARVR